ncbi:MAG: hypothetical protein WAW34_14385 [Rhodoferax sp.]
MDFTKFVSLLQSRSLFFARADKFEDPFEGSWPKRDAQQRWAEASQVASDDGIPFPLKKAIFIKDMREFHAINCWHLNDYESAAMWKLYLTSNEGIAVQSTYSNLRKSIVDDREVFMGRVRYIDFQADQIGHTSSISDAFMFKRKSFEHEQEIRALVVKHPFDDQGKPDKPFGQGVSLRTDLEQLVERVHIAPTAPNWFGELVRNVVMQYQYKFEVIQSEMNVSPMY